ncbi:unnamed protein product [Porites evermanni]|uniref:Uncharacterized protein n=1 Tax=Porites evermanni TaxID=104178 RepID=A0ABN8MJJ1_9CNID|nr:unnamed protein product [Porites evermanni]
MMYPHYSPINTHRAFSRLICLHNQRSADRVRKDIYSLGAKIDVNVKPVFTSRKLSQTLSVKENKPPIVNTQCVVYLFQCGLCDANNVGKFDCLVYEMLYIKDIKPSLNTQADCIRAKLFT